MTETKNLPTILFCSFMLVVFVWGYDVAHTPEVKAVSVSQAAPQTIVATPSPIPTPAPDLDTPEGYIRYRFAEHADKAFLLLKGDGISNCAENRKLNPRAVNDNTVWGGVGVDRGIFQINSVYHPLTEAQAFDYKTNIDYAFRMFSNDHNSFKRWTCGRHYGI